MFQIDCPGTWIEFTGGRVFLDGYGKLKYKYNFLYLLGFVDVFDMCVRCV